MELFYKAKNRDRVTDISDKSKRNKLSFEVQTKTTSDGRLQIDFYEKDADFKQFYDTTRLIIDSNGLSVGNHLIHNCMVAWYRQEDNINAANKEVRRLYYKTVLAEIDLKLLKSDSNYCNKVMKELLSKKSVEKYLENGLEEKTDFPCGNYIGGVRKVDNVYQRIFTREVGKYSHDSEYMINKRREHREIEMYRKAIRESSKFQIEKIKDEGEEWYK